MHPFSLITTDAAAAGWKEYPQPRLGFTIEFPAEPLLFTSLYRTVLVPSATAYVFSHATEEVTVAAAAVDLPEREEEGTVFIGEAESILTQLGNVTSVTVSRVQSGSASVYGRLITLQCRTARAQESVRTWFKNLTGSDPVPASRVIANLLFNRGRLYILHGMSISGNGDAPSLAAILHFVNSATLFETEEKSR